MKRVWESIQQGVLKIFHSVYNPQTSHPRLWTLIWYMYRTLETILLSGRSSVSDVISHELTGPHKKNDAHMHDRVSHGKKEEK